MFFDCSDRESIKKDYDQTVQKRAFLSGAIKETITRKEEVRAESLRLTRVVEPSAPIIKMIQASLIELTPAS